MTQTHEALHLVAGARRPQLDLAVPLRNGWRLQTKLIASHAAVGAIVTALSLLAVHYVHRQADEQQSQRTLVTSGIQELFSLTASASEEGFSYVLSADPEERVRFESKLDAAGRRCAALESAGLSEDERGSLQVVLFDVRRLRAAGDAMFDTYRLTHGLPAERYAEYEAAIDGASDDIAVLASVARARGAVTGLSTHRTSSVLSLLIGLFAMAVAVALGTALGRRLGRPLTALRDAAVAFGEGRLDHQTVRSEGEIGEVASAFETMKARVQDNQRILLTTEKMAVIGRLTAGIAHEMNSPLAALILSIDELRGLVSEYGESISDPSVLPADHVAINKQMAESLELAETAARRSADFVRSIRSQTRVASSAKQERFDPATVVEDAANMVRSGAHAARCTISIDRAGSADLHGNPTLLGQAITNLLQNAIDATGDHGGGEVKVTVEADPDHVRIGVADTGPGILPEVLPRIFEALYTTKAYGRGTGLGLAIVKEAVEGGFGGHTHVATTVGKGTTFTLHLPRIRGASHGT